MSAKFPFPLSLEYVRSAPPSTLLASLQWWVKTSDPVCLTHPHGFFVILLHRSKTEDWRFHWWPAGPKIRTGMPATIHNHDKIVASRVLEGTLTNLLYDVKETQTGGQPIYQVAYLGDKYTPSTSNILIKTAGRAHVSVLGTQTMFSGDNYIVDRNFYHEAVVPDNAVTATIVCMHSPSSDPVRVIGMDGYPERIEFQRIECKAKECLSFC